MMYISLTLVEGAEFYDHRNRRLLFFKEVHWPCVPIPKNYDTRVALGKSENGEETGWSLAVNSLWFDSDGDITIELHEALNPEVDKYDEFVKDLERDGFLEYDEWVKVHP